MRETLFVSLLFIISISAFAKKKKEESLIDHIHSRLSGDIISAATRLDNFFGTERADDEANGTRIRVYTISTKFEGENPSTQGDIQLQLVLPKTQNRLRLVVESDDDRNEESSGTNSANSPATSNSQRTAGQQAAESTTAALRYIVDTAGIRTSFDAGLRFTDSPKIFYRMRFRKNIPLGKWVFRPVEQIFWVQDEGHSSDTDLDFDRKINEKWNFRFVNNIFWNDQDYFLDFTNGPSWFQKINEKIGMSYNFRVISSNTPDMAVNNYIASVGYRQLLYKKWFFWTLTPALSFPREENFHRTPSFTVRFDVILGSI